MIPFSYSRTKYIIFGMFREGVMVHPLYPSVSFVLICCEASADRCGWAWPRCFIPCFTVYCLLLKLELALLQLSS